jgi:prepilin-type N-terminal cleavage/methylation domain-containing protein
MDSVNGQPLPGGARDERGFTLIELIVAMMVLTVGLLPLAALFATSVQRMGASTPMLIAREKAREAIESVHAARDTGEASWITIQNEDDAEEGVFLDGPQRIAKPGADGLVNTSDDGEDEFPEGMFTREIEINELLIDGTSTVNPNLRELVVIVRFRVNTIWQEYRVVTYISSYS